MASYEKTLFRFKIIFFISIIILFLGIYQYKTGNLQKFEFFSKNSKLSPDLVLIAIGVGGIVGSALPAYYIKKQRKQGMPFTESDVKSAASNYIKYDIKYHFLVLSIVLLIVGFFIIKEKPYLKGIFLILVGAFLVFFVTKVKIKKKINQ